MSIQEKDHSSYSYEYEYRYLRAYRDATAREAGGAGIKLDHDTKAGREFNSPWKLINDRQQSVL